MAMGKSETSWKQQRSAYETNNSKFQQRLGLKMDDYPLTEVEDIDQTFSNAAHVSLTDPHKCFMISCNALLSDDL